MLLRSKGMTTDFSCKRSVDRELGIEFNGITTTGDDRAAIVEQSNKYSCLKSRISDYS
jgi:hypothetical protein